MLNIYNRTNKMSNMSISITLHFGTQGNAVTDHPLLKLLLCFLFLTHYFCPPKVCPYNPNSQKKIRFRPKQILATCHSSATMKYLGRHISSWIKTFTFQVCTLILSHNLLQPSSLFGTLPSKNHMALGWAFTPRLPPYLDGWTVCSIDNIQTRVIIC